jgi:CRP-like cAMP-binding protein
MSQADHFGKLKTLGDAAPSVARIREIIEAIKLFEDFEPEELNILARYMRSYHAGEGFEIIHEGESGDFMMLILEGNIEIVKKDHRGLPAQIAIVGPGKTLGEMSLIDGEPRFASCIALGEVDFAVLDRESLSHLIADNPRIGVKLMMEFLMLLNERLRNVSSQLMECVEARRNRIR